MSGATHLPAEPADANEVWVTIEGQPFRLVPYGSETIDGLDLFSRPCHVCGAAPGTYHSNSCGPGRGGLYARPAHCRNCGVPIGSVHWGNCCVEQCPRCEGQYASCACDSSEDATESEEEE